MFNPKTNNTETTEHFVSPIDQSINQQDNEHIMDQHESWLDISGS